MSRPAFCLLTFLPELGGGRSSPHCQRKELSRIRVSEDAASVPTITLSVCTSASCALDGSKKLLDMLKALQEENGDFEVVSCGCLGRCGEGPSLVNSKAKSVVTGVANIDSALPLLPAGSSSSSLVECFRLKESGNIFLSKSKRAEAISAYTAALDLLSSDGEEIVKLRSSLLCNRATAFMEIGELDKAEEDINSAIDRTPGLAPAWRRRGEVLSKKKDVEAAVRAYEMAMKLDPSSERDIQKLISATQRKEKRFGLF